MTSSGCSSGNSQPRVSVGVSGGADVVYLLRGDGGGHPARDEFLALDVGEHAAAHGHRLLSRHRWLSRVARLLTGRVLIQTSAVPTTAEVFFYPHLRAIDSDLIVSGSEIVLEYSPL